ncbi:MAG: extracellular solute-binding protein [Phascolarctobacterium sp.]|nr:extracellular solute-binding protein [Phascolarctobacterium sp.]
MKKLFFVMALLLGIGAYFMDFDRSSDDEKKELNICSSIGKDITEVLANDFAKKNGVKVNISYLPGGSFEARKQFLEQNKFDCWLGGSSEEYFMAEEEGLLRRYVAKESYKVPAQLRNLRGDWTALYLSYVAVISNKDNLREQGIYAPTTWVEFLDPTYKDKLVFPNPQIGGVAYGMLTGIWQINGKTEALEYAAKLNAQNPLVVNSFNEAVELVYNGKKTSTIVPLDYALFLESKHPHLFATVPKDANRNVLTGVAILKTANAITNAENFIDYLMSDASMTNLAANGYYYMWHVKNYNDAKERTHIVGRLHVPTDDLGWSSTYKNEVIRQWQEAKLPEENKTAEQKTTE